MIEIAVPGRDIIRLRYAIFDFNGTLAVAGRLREGVAGRLHRLAEQLELHALTGDTYGTAREALAGLPLAVAVMPDHNQAEAKQEALRALGTGSTAAIGNGYNDRLIVSEAALGVAVLEGEGASTATLAAADVVCTSILDALDLLLHPKRLVATLRY